MRGLRAGAVLGALVMVASACGSDSGDEVATVAPNVWVNRADEQVPIARLHEAPAVLIDQDDPDTVYLGQVEMLTGSCRFYRSDDGAQTWRAMPAPELEPFTQNCAMGTATSQNIRTELQQTPDGTVYMVFQANAPNRNGSRSVMLGRSSDGGNTWETVPIDPGEIAPEPGFLMQVNFEGHLAIDPSNPDRMYAMWRRSNNNKDRDREPAPGPTRPFMAMSTDGGATWSDPQMVVDENTGFDGPRPVVVGDDLWTFFRISASSDNPETRVMAAVSSDDGATWTQHEITRADDASEPVPLYDRERGRFYLVWHDNSEGELDAYFASSPDGTTWSEPQILNDDPRGTRIGQHYPQISMSPDGRIDVAWYDWRDDPFPAPIADEDDVLSLFSNRGVIASVYVASSEDGGATWGDNVKVNDVPIDRSIGSWKNNHDVLAPVALDSWNDATIVAWSDTRRGNQANQAQDVFTAVVSYGAADADDDVGPLAAGLVGALLGLGIAMCLAFFLSRSRSAPATAKPAAKPSGG